MGNPWIGVDFDGTLVKHESGDSFSTRGPNYVGRPVEKMIGRVKQWIAEGKEVRIVTARVSMGDNRESVRRPLIAFCIYHFGKELPITNEKDYDMVELWDDRAVQVIMNTGERADGKE